MRIVLLKPSANMPAAKQQARNQGASIGLTYHHALKGFSFKGSAQAVAALRRNPQVQVVSPDHALTLTETLPYGVKRIDAYVPGSSDGAYQNGFRGTGARIAIIDTGIDLDHPDLAASIDIFGGKNCLAPGTPPNDGHGHGTHVAGTVAAVSNNGSGVAGVAFGARVLPLRVLGRCGGYTSDIADAIVWASGGTVTGVPANANVARVISMSLGGQGSCDTTTQNAINSARSRGSVGRPRPCARSRPASGRASR